MKQFTTKRGRQKEMDGLKIIRCEAKYDLQAGL